MNGSLLLSVFGWLAGWWLWGRPRTLQEVAEGRPAGQLGRRVTVVVPARDEVHAIGGLLDDLLVQTIDVQVVVVDDHSSDGTAAVAARIATRGAGRVRVVPAPPLPPGWVGKNWACHHGARLALGAGAGDADVLAFVDADVRVEPESMERVAALVEPGRVVSIQPFHTTRRCYEQLSLFSGLVALSAIGAGRRRRAPYGLCGPVLAMSVADHRRVGGHEAVRGELVEDLALGRLLTRAGVETHVLLGGRSVRYRMYPLGVAQLVEGWTKNLAAGAGAVPWWRTAASVVWITALGDAAVDLVREVPAGDHPVLATLVYAAFAVQVGVLGRRTGTFGPGTAVLYPVPLAAFVALFLRSVWRRTVRHQVTWRGRRVPTSDVRTPT